MSLIVASFDRDLANVRKFESVFDQIDQHLFQTPLIAKKFRQLEFGRVSVIS